MGSRKTKGTRPERRFVVQGVRRQSPDLRKLGRVLIAIAQAEQQRRAETAVPEDGP